MTLAGPETVSGARKRRVPPRDTSRWPSDKVKSRLVYPDRVACSCAVMAVAVFKAMTLPSWGLLNDIAVPWSLSPYQPMTFGLVLGGSRRVLSLGTDRCFSSCFIPNLSLSLSLLLSLSLSLLFAQCLGYFFFLSATHTLFFSVPRLLFSHIICFLLFHFLTDHRTAAFPVLFPHGTSHSFSSCHPHHTWRPSVRPSVRRGRF